MHVKGKKIAMAGLLVALTVVMLVLSSVIETNSLFLIAAASFCVGIAVREWGNGFGAAFLLASVMINLFVAPNKFYCITFAGMGIYLCASEFLWDKIATASHLRHRNAALWLGKYLIFNLMYVPVLFLAPQFIFTGKMNGLAAAMLLVVGQAVLFVYDQAHRYFQVYIWGKIRKKLIGD